MLYQPLPEALIHLERTEFNLLGTGSPVDPYELCSVQDSTPPDVKTFRNWLESAAIIILELCGDCTDFTIIHGKCGSTRFVVDPVQKMTAICTSCRQGFESMSAKAYAFGSDEPLPEKEAAKET